MVGLPRVQRVRRPEDRAVAFGHLDLVRDRRDDVVADVVERDQRIRGRVLERVGPDDARRARFDEFARDGDTIAAALHRTARDVVDVEHTPRFLGTDVAFTERKHAAVRDDEHHAQLGQPRDDVVREPLGEAAACVGACRAIDERHHRDRRAA